MSSVEEVATEELVPSWFADMEFCHISPEEELDHDAAYCGHIDHIGLGGEGTTCGEYLGEAICPWCGNPTCPRCAQLSALVHALDES